MTRSITKIDEMLESVSTLDNESAGERISHLLNKTYEKFYNSENKDRAITRSELKDYLSVAYARFPSRKIERSKFIKPDLIYKTKEDIVETCFVFNKAWKKNYNPNMIFKLKTEKKKDKSTDGICPKSNSGISSCMWQI